MDEQEAKDGPEILSATRAEWSYYDLEARHRGISVVEMYDLEQNAARELAALNITEEFLGHVQCVASPPQASWVDMQQRLENVVACLADQYKFNWTRTLSRRDAADEILRVMAHFGLIGHWEHPSGGYVWEVNGKVFGRTDGIVPGNWQPGNWHPVGDGMHEVSTSGGNG